MLGLGGSVVAVAPLLTSAEATEASAGSSATRT